MGGKNSSTMSLRTGDKNAGSGPMTQDAARRASASLTHDPSDSKAGLFNRHKVYTDMSFGELKDARHNLRYKHQLETFAKYSEQLLRLCENASERAEITLQLADAQFDAGRFDKASDNYNTFYQLYPGHSKTEYALYRAITSASMRILSADRDQTQTHETLELSQAFLERPLFTKYRKEVEKLRTDCYRRLLESELSICEFYIKRGNTKSAETRLSEAKTTLLPHVPDMEAAVASHEGKLNEEVMKVQEKQQQMAQPKQSPPGGKGSNQPRPHLAKGKMQKQRLAKSIKQAAGPQKRTRLAQRF